MSAPVIITPAAPIISAADAKLRQTDLAGATDAVVNAAIATATTALENYTGRAIGVQTLDWYPDETDSNFRMYRTPLSLRKRLAAGDGLSLISICRALLSFP
jgi:hypothetical protein